MGAVILQYCQPCYYATVLPRAREETRGVGSTGKVQIILCLTRGVYFGVLQCQYRAYGSTANICYLLYCLYCQLSSRAWQYRQGS